MSSFSPSPWLRSLWGLAMLCAALSSRAQEGAPPALTLTAALERAAGHNPALAAQRYSERAAGALVEQAGLRPNPTLDVTLENFAGTGRLRGADDLEATVQASQTIERGNKRGKRVTAAERDRDIAAAEFAVQRTETLAATAIAYVEAVAAEQRLALAAEPLQLARDTLASVEARLKTATASLADSARARAALASAQLDQARAASARTKARAYLATLWGGHADDVGPLVVRLQVPDTLPAPESLLGGLTQHPRLGLQQAVIASRRASLDLAQAQGVSDITVGGGLRFLREGSDAAFVAGVSVPLPVRNQNQGNIRAARETLAGAEQSVPAVEAALRAGFTAAWSDLTAAHHTVLNLRREALPATVEAQAIVRRAYEQGLLPLIDVLEAQRALAALRRELLEAEAAYAVALARAEALAAPAFPATNALFSQP